MGEHTRGTISYGGSITATAPATPYDVAIIGAGVVGCALAYELSRHALRVVVLDRNHDVGEGTSKANSAIVHTGFDASPGSLESELVTAASRAWPELAHKLKIPLVQTSALLVATTDEQAALLPALERRAHDNGVDDVAIVSAAEVRRLEPHVTALARGGLLVPRESVIDPFAVCVAYAEVALGNGVDFRLGVEVTRIDAGGVDRRVECGDAGSVAARVVVNVAGAGSRALACGHGGEPFDINPRRGQFLVYDRHARALVSRILLPIPTEHSKGMLVAPTVFGNVLAGPTAEDLPPDQWGATGTTVEGLARVRAAAEALCPELAAQPVIATYAGLRCHCAQGSYWIRFNDGSRGVVTVSGVRSTGMTASIALARHLVRGMERFCDLVLRPDPRAVDARPESAWPGWWKRPYQDAARVRQRPEYGAIVCACEQVSRGEIIDALGSPLAPRTLDAIKRRTRALTGRCQAFHCGVSVARIIHEHCGIPLARVTKRGPGSEIAVQGGEARRARPRAAASEPAHRHYRVAVVGAGPAGVGVAVGLARRGIGPVLVIERAAEPGGVPARYAAARGGVPTFVAWTRGRVVAGRDYADALARRLEATGSELWLEAQVVAASRRDRVLAVVRPGLGLLHVTADAVVLACGARERTLAERGWIAGHRPARVMPTMQLLDLLDDGCLPMRQPIVLGSDLIAYAAAAKLHAAGAARARILDRGARPAAGLGARMYFWRWGRPRWCGGVSEARIGGSGHAAEIWTPAMIEGCDGVVVSGELIPNSELAVEAGLEVAMPGRRPALAGGTRFAAAGFFAAGNILGGYHGAEWCYCHGKHAARAVAGYLAETARQPLLAAAR